MNMNAGPPASFLHSDTLTITIKASLSAPDDLKLESEIIKKEQDKHIKQNVLTRYLRQI